MIHWLKHRRCVWWKEVSRGSGPVQDERVHCLKTEAIPMLSFHIVIE